ncbi:MAG: MATE family efflux transporter [Mycoplasmatales bacterium]
MINIFQKTYKTNQIKEIFWPIAISMILSQLITFVDSAFISNYSTSALAGIGIANQLRMCFGPMYYGVVSGIAIYTAQSTGSKNYIQMKYAFGLGFIILLVISSIHALSVILFHNQFVSFFVEPNSIIGTAAIDYLIYIVPTAFLMPMSMIFMFQFRALKMARLTMYVSSGMALCNTILDIFLIYGVGSFPELGTKGAAIATTLSYMIFLSVYIIIAIKVRAEFISRPKYMFGFNKDFVKSVIKTIAPLIYIEFLFGFSRVLYTKMYVDLSVADYTVNLIASNISLLVNFFVIATASTAGIIMGEALGRGDTKEIDDTKSELHRFMYRHSLYILLFIVLILPILIPLYTPNDIIIDHYYIKVYIVLIITGIYMAIRVHSSTYVSILKSGGDTKAIIFADPASSYLIGLPLTFIGLYFLGFNLIILKILWLAEIVGKYVFSKNRYNKNIWIRKV